VFNAPPSCNVTDITVFGQEIPPVNFSNTNLTSPIETTAQRLWLPALLGTRLT